MLMGIQKGLNNSEKEICCKVECLEEAAGNYSLEIKATTKQQISMVEVEPNSRHEERVPQSLKE